MIQSQKLPFQLCLRTISGSACSRTMPGDSDVEFDTQSIDLTLAPAQRAPGTSGLFLEFLVSTEEQSHTGAQEQCS